MSSPLQHSTRNHLLRAMEPEDYGLLGKHLTLVQLSKSESLVEPDKPLRYSWFLESGIASVVADSPQGHQTEVGIVGREGMVDVATLHGLDSASDRCFVQIPGAAWRLPANILRDACEASATLRHGLLAFAYSFKTQISGTALANGSFSLERRLARWLLMCHDRVDGDDIGMTHEFLALMLNVRRAGVTVAMQALEKLALIEGRRSVVAIIDRPGLEEFAADCYGGPEAVYQRLVGRPHLDQTGTCAE